ncbi:MAG: hypothetical protein CW691_06990, partial [Candidatus Bathyarchaeum sp.]
FEIHKTIPNYLVSSQQTTDEESGIFQTDGKNIVDKNGQSVQIRALGCDYTAYNRFYNLEKFAQWAKSSGANALRLAFNVPGYRVSHTEYDPELMDQALKIVTEDYGLYAILDSHHYWATSEIQGWEDVLPNHKSDWIETWVDIAERYKDNEMVVMYELANEPYGSGGEELRNTYYEVTDAIRATGDNHIVLCSIPERTFVYEVEKTNPESTWYDPSQIRENMALNIHSWHHFDNDEWFKENTEGVDQVAEIVASEWIATALNYEEILDCPVLLGEFGVYNHDMDSSNVYENSLKINWAENYDLSWMNWMCEQWNNYAPTFWQDFVSQEFEGNVDRNPTISGSFNFEEFDALPFNIWDHIDKSKSQRYQEPGYNRWGVTFVSIPQNYPITFTGECKLRVQVWGSGQPYWGTITKDYFVDIPAGQSWTIGNSQNPIEGYTMVYAWD